MKNVIVQNVSLPDEENEILNVYIKLEQAMIDKDINVLNEIITDDSIFIHMSGKMQRKSEFLKEIENGILNYYKTEINNIEIVINKNTAHMTGYVILTAKVYGISGKWTLDINDDFKKIDGKWYYSKLNASK